MNNFAYGINGGPPCTSDYAEFFDGTDSNAISLRKLCGAVNPGVFRTTSSSARVVFAAFTSPQNTGSQVGMSVAYNSIQL